MLHSHLKSEILIINLLKASNEAREFVADHLDSWVSLEREMLLTWLPKQDQLKTIADNMRCSEDEVFELLATQFQETIRRQPLPPFTFEHLHKLASNPHQRRVAQIIECDPRDVLNELFNVNAILEVLFEFDPDWVRQQYINTLSKDQNASFVLLKLLATKEQIETRYNIDNYGWEEFLDTRHIISNYAFEKLQDNAIKQGFITEASSRLLAVALDEELRPRRVRYTYDDVFLDGLGILEIKRRTDWIVQQLRESVQYTTNTETILDIDRIQTCLEFFELREPAVAWRKFLKSEVNLPSLRDKLVNLHIQSTNKSGTPQTNAQLRVRAEEILSKPSWIQFWKKKSVIDNKLIVSCVIYEQSLPVDILICSKVSSSQVSDLSDFFTSLQGDTIATGYVPDLGKQLLDKQFVFHEDIKAGIQNVSNQFLVELIRGLILRGVTVPCDIDPVWKNRINSSLPITPIHYKAKENLPTNRGQLLKNIEQIYSIHNNVKRVS